MPQVVVQKWLESESNWGTSPDGYSIHLTEADLEVYIRDYWSKMPNEVQDVYSRPDGKPYMADVDETTFAMVKASKSGLREYYAKPPGSGGTDGWLVLS